MSDTCQLVVFSNKAYNAIIRESFDKDPVETGGILLGHVLDNGVWIVMEVLPPGINSIFQYAYFEYDEAFVNYLAQSVANQYKRPLDLLGLWHRHPGGMDVFSTTDDGTNLTFARQNPAGVISGLVNIDPRFRLTMYHLDCPTHRPMGRPDYSVVEVEVGDDIIPEEYFELRYFDGNEANLHPTVPRRKYDFQPRQVMNDRDVVSDTDVDHESSENGELNINRIISGQLPPCSGERYATPELINNFFPFWRDSKKRWWYVLLAAVVLIAAAYTTIKLCKLGIEHFVDDEKTDNVENVSDFNKPSLSVDSITLNIDDAPANIVVYNLPNNTDVRWESSDRNIVSVSNGIISPIKTGEAEISVFNGDVCIGKCIVTIKDFEEETYAVSDISLRNSSGSVQVGKSFELPLQNADNAVISYSSSDSIIAIVSPKGVVTGKGKGVAIIKIFLKDKDSLEYKVEVR